MNNGRFVSNRETTKDACIQERSADVGAAIAEVDVPAINSEVDRVLVARLRRLYWPRWIAQLTRPRVLRARPRAYVSEYDRWTDRGYDAGRVHFFLKKLRAQGDLDPICIDMTWFGSSPAGVIVYDGHHRFAAYVLARRRYIPASMGGLCDMRDYLVGKRSASPIL